MKQSHPGTVPPETGEPSDGPPAVTPEALAVVARVLCLHSSEERLEVVAHAVARFMANTADVWRFDPAEHEMALEFMSGGVDADH
jgi:hypothetical protein